LVATEEFRDAAAAQGRSLGFSPAIVWVPHPVQNRTAEELAEMAAEAIPQILRLAVSNTEAE
jgi:hypothetical protein